MKLDVTNQTSQKCPRNATRTRKEISWAAVFPPCSAAGRYIVEPFNLLPFYAVSFASNAFLRYFAGLRSAWNVDTTNRRNSILAVNLAPCFVLYIGDVEFLFATDR